MIKVISKKLDCRWIYEPFYLFPLRKALNEMNSGEILEFLIDANGCDLDMQAWSKLTGHKLLEFRDRENYYQYYIQKKFLEANMAEAKVDTVLDCKGMLCPMPVVKTNKAMKSLEVGQVLEMISTDPGSIPDMEAWARQTGHELLEAKQDNNEYRFKIKKTH